MPLLRRAKAGDVEAFAELFESLRPVVFSVAYRVVGPNDADDVVMESYLKAWRALPRFNERSSLKTWLFRIARNCALDAIRSRNRRHEEPRPDGEDGVRGISEMADDRQPSPAEDLIAADLKAEVQEAVRQLDDIHRTALLLRYTDRLSYAEIAAATGVSMGTVMSRLFNAKRKLRRLVSSD